MYMYNVMQILDLFFNIIKIFYFLYIGIQLYMKFEYIWILLFNILKMKFGGKYIGLKYWVLISFFIDYEYNLLLKCCFIGILILINKGKLFI